MSGAVNGELTPDVAAMPRTTSPEAAPMLSVRDLHVRFDAGDGHVVQAVSGVSFDIMPGETLGLVGESGCGKSTTSRAIMQLPPPSSGSVLFEGVDLTRLPRDQLRETRTRMQMIFQDPVSSLNPRRNVQSIIAEPLATWGRGSKQERVEKVHELMDAVGLDAAAVGKRRRREFSGGQCQRISIARALALDPRLLICDEAVSALDVSVQAQILNLLQAMKRRFDLTMVFVAHDLAVVKRLSDRVAVMYLGKIVEIAPADALYSEPRHHYTQALLRSIPQPDPTVPPADVPLKGEPPSPTDPPSGCRFRTRCERAEQLCAEIEPPLADVGPGHQVACHFPLPVTPVELTPRGLAV
ncbi:MAG: ABC transporter ATP-binding protein [Ilumatobacteraceae bacterium]|jgi:peptide/nickel transport system ATP-binding protein